MKQLFVGLLATALLGITASGALAAGPCCPTPGDRGGECAPGAVTSDALRVNGIVREPGVDRQLGQVTFRLVDGRQVYSVLAGPADYLREIGLTLRSGTRVMVSGWQVQEGREPRLIAGEIFVGSRVHTLRDKYGVPVWNAWHQPVHEPVKPAPTSDCPRCTPRPCCPPTYTGQASSPVTLHGQVVDVKRVYYNRQPYHRVVVVHGPYREVVYLGPVSYTTSLGINFRTGSRISITGWHTIYDSQRVLLAHSIGIGHSTYRLHHPYGWHQPRSGFTLRVNIRR